MKLTIKRLPLMVAVGVAVCLQSSCGLIHDTTVTRNETAAFMAMRAIERDNRAFKIKAGAYAESLNGLGTIDKSEFERAKSAYEFAYQQVGDTFEVTAKPKVYPKTGIRYFYVNQTGTLRFETGKPAGPLSPDVSQR